MIKRAFDLVAALAGVVVLSPVLLLVAVAVRISMGRPVLFKQVRPGKDCAPFQVLKFRTMTNGRAADGSLLPDAERTTRLGGWLRRASLDELPQLFNVIRGDLSLVGPRPLRTAYLERYSERQMRRHEVRPGITGWAQVNGRNAISWEEKFELDVWYVENQTFLLDLRILTRTVRIVMGGGGVNQSQDVTMSPFLGSRGQLADNEPKGGAE